jgi:hypothetical protein
MQEPIMLPRHLADNRSPITRPSRLRKLRQHSEARPATPALDAGCSNAPNPRIVRCWQQSQIPGSLWPTHLSKPCRFGPLVRPFWRANSTTAIFRWLLESGLFPVPAEMQPLDSCLVLLRFVRLLMTRLEGHDANESEYRRPEETSTAEAETLPAPGSVLSHFGPTDSFWPRHFRDGLRMVESPVIPGRWHRFAYCYPGSRVACYRVDGPRQASALPRHSCHHRNITMTDSVTNRWRKHHLCERLD